MSNVRECMRRGLLNPPLVPTCDTQEGLWDSAGRPLGGDGGVAEISEHSRLAWLSAAAAPHSLTARKQVP